MILVTLTLQTTPFPSYDPKPSVASLVVPSLRQVAASKNMDAVKVGGRNDHINYGGIVLNHCIVLLICLVFLLICMHPRYSIRKLCLSSRKLQPTIRTNILNSLQYILTWVWFCLLLSSFIFLLSSFFFLLSSLFFLLSSFFFLLSSSFFFLLPHTCQTSSLALCSDQ